MELLEGILLLAEGHRATLGNDLDGGSEVLELGAFGEIGDLDLDIGRGHHVEGPLRHVDGRLPGARGADGVLGRERGPEQRTGDASVSELLDFDCLAILSDLARVEEGVVRAKRPNGRHGRGRHQQRLEYPDHDFDLAWGKRCD